MSHYYGSLHGNRGAASRGGSRTSGYVSRAMSYDGMIEVRLTWNDEHKCDWATIEQAGHPEGPPGVSRTIYDGPLNTQRAMEYEDDKE